MAEKRQKKQAVKAFEKETFSKDKEVTGAKHTEHRQDNTFPTENHFHANEKPVSNMPRDANHGSRTGKATSGHSVQKSEFNTGTEYRKNNKKKYYRQQQQDTSGHNVQKSEAEAEKTFLKENSFINEENGNATNFHTEDADSFQDNYHVRNTYQRSEEKGKYHKRRVQREHAHRERAKSENTKQSDYGDLQTKDATFSQGQADEFTDQKVQKAFDKSEKNRRKLQKAKDKMSTKRQYEMKRVFDEQTGKANGNRKRRFQSMKNRKLSARAVVSLMLSAILFCMPIGAFFANRTNTIEVHAEDTAEQKTESASDAENTVTPGNGREENSGTDTGEGKTENSTEGTTEDSSEETQPSAKCTCKEKCSQYAVDEDCEVCAKDYKE